MPTIPTPQAIEEADRLMDTLDAVEVGGRSYSWRTSASGQAFRNRIAESLECFRGDQPRQTFGEAEAACHQYARSKLT